MISYIKKWLYIHPSKTGGTSIELALGPYSDNTLATARRAGNFYVYDRGRDIKHVKPEFFGKTVLSEYYLFMTTRNPWDRVVSAWCYFNPSMSLADYLLSKNFQSPHYDPIMDWAGKHDFTFIEFENLQKDFDKVCKALNIPQQRLPHVAKSVHQHYSLYYTKELREAVAEKYAADIEFFGYEFEDDNTDNDTDVQQSGSAEQGD